MSSESCHWKVNEPGCCCSEREESEGETTIGVMEVSSLSSVTEMLKVRGEEWEIFRTPVTLLVITGGRLAAERGRRKV